MLVLGSATVVLLVHRRRGSSASTRVARATVALVASNTATVRVVLPVVVLQ